MKLRLDVLQNRHTHRRSLGRQAHAQGLSQPCVQSVVVTGGMEP